MLSAKVRIKHPDGSAQSRACDENYGGRKAAIQTKFNTTGEQTASALQAYEALLADEHPPMIAQANSPAELLKTARECVQRRQFTRARQMLAQLVECEPQNVQGWMLLARLGELALRQGLPEADQHPADIDCNPRPVLAEPPKMQPTRQRPPRRTHPWTLYFLAACASASMWLMLVALVSIAAGPPLPAREPSTIAPAIPTPVAPPAAAPVVTPTLEPKSIPVPVPPKPAPLLIG